MLPHLPGLELEDIDKEVEDMLLVDKDKDMDKDLLLEDIDKELELEDMVLDL